jgi:glycine/D-amino acid oxidase-like deaminating enzyme
MQHWSCLMDLPVDSARYHERHAAIVRPDDLAWPIHLVGAGAVGSFAALLLAKLGPPDLHVYDHDLVGPENVGTQLYGPEDIGRPKAAALAALVERLAGVRPAAHIERVGERAFDGVVVLAVDAMHARRMIFERSIGGRASVRWLLDARIGFLPDTRHAPVGLLFTVRPLDPAERAEYEHSLYSDETALPTPCGAGGIAYASVLAAGAIGRRIVQIARRERVPLIERLMA